LSKVPKPSAGPWQDFVYELMIKELQIIPDNFLFPFEGDKIAYPAGEASLHFPKTAAECESAIVTARFYGKLSFVSRCKLTSFSGFIYCSSLQDCRHVTIS
jgi:hypothetical protein